MATQSEKKKQKDVTHNKGKRDATCPIWNDVDNTKYYANKDFKLAPQEAQKGAGCVAIALAIVTQTTKQSLFVDTINTQDPVSWSEALKPFGMKLAYCAVDIRRVKHYMDELLLLDDLFLISYYTDRRGKFTDEPDKTGWVCGSHIIVLHRDTIFDAGKSTPAKEHACNEYHTKRIFRIVPLNHPRGL